MCVCLYFYNGNVRVEPFSITYRGRNIVYVCVYTFIVITFVYDLSQLPNQEDKLCMCVFLVVTYALSLSQLLKEEGILCMCVFVLL